jgi:hypothetical protein
MWRIVSYLRDCDLEMKGFCPAVDTDIFLFIFPFKIIRNCNAKIVTYYYKLVIHGASGN